MSEFTALENIGSPKKIETKHGLAFDVILDRPKCPTPSKLTPNNTPSRTVTNEEIRMKLQKAEERRHSIEMSKLSGISEKFQKIEEVAKSREEQNQKFSKQTEEKLLLKMESNKENKAALFTTLMEKLQKTDAKISHIKQLKEKTTQLLEENIKNKLLSAEENRSEILQAQTEKIKEHDRHIEEVRKATQCVTSELEEKIETKLQNALTFREEQLEKIKEKIREHQKHVIEVREHKALTTTDSTSPPIVRVDLIDRA